MAVDFDGTCVKHEYPEVGGDVGAVPVLKRLVDDGARIILWTMRSDSYLDSARKWFEDNGIPLFGVNRNPEQDRWTSSPKAYAGLYIDDAALGCPLKTDGPPGSRPFVDWDQVEVSIWGNRKASEVENSILKEERDEARAECKRWREAVVRHIGHVVTPDRFPWEHSGEPDGPEPVTPQP